VIQDVDDFQAMLLPKFVVVQVVRWGDLQAPRTECDVDILVFNDGYFAVHERHNSRFPFEVRPAPIVRVDAYGAISHDGLRPGGSDGEVGGRIARRTFYRILYVVERLVHFSADDLFIRDGRAALRVPID